MIEAATRDEPRGSSGSTVDRILRFRLYQVHCQPERGGRTDRTPCVIATTESAH